MVMVVMRCGGLQLGNSGCCEVPEGLQGMGGKQGWQLVQLALTGVPHMWLMHVSCSCGLLPCKVCDVMVSAV